jgi:alkenylglycerophosphocholine/alkenylglycerophosphoethanolamine hydrolase
MSAFPLLALTAMILDWIGRARGSKPLEYVGKPLAMVFLLAWLYQATGFAGGVAWFALALLFSLIGDIFLMLPQEQFVAGLAAFLLAQLSYIITFNRTPFGAGSSTWVLALLVLALGVWVYSQLASGLQASGTPRMRLPLLIYSLALAGMLFSGVACLARPAWSFTAAAPVAFGAALFFASDSLLGWNKFVAPVRGGRTLVHITYHLGQLGITLGVILHSSIHFVV